MPVRIPPHILSLKPYVPGKPIEEVERELGIRGSIKLASNENPIGPSPLALEAIQGEMSNLHRYPEGSGIRLKEALARKHGVAPEPDRPGERIERGDRSFWPAHSFRRATMP